MIKEGTVSLWLGNVDTEENFDTMVETDYNEDGDFVPSKFDNLYQIDYYNESTKEVHFANESVDSLEKLLEGFSYDETIIPQFAKFDFKKVFTDYNSIVLLYDFEHTQEVKIVSEQGFYFEFIGFVPYDLD